MTTEEKEKLNGPYVEHHPNGKLFRKGNYINGKREGYWEVYYSNGHLMHKSKFLNDKVIGLSINEIQTNCYRHTFIIL